MATIKSSADSFLSADELDTPGIKLFALETKLSEIKDEAVCSDILN